MAAARANSSGKLICFKSLKGRKEDTEQFCGRKFLLSLNVNEKKSSGKERGHQIGHRSDMQFWFPVISNTF